MSTDAYNQDKMLANKFEHLLDDSDQGYTLEHLYRLVGRYDYVVTITLRPNSEAENKYGSELTIVLIYDQKKREEMEGRFQKNLDGTYGVVKAKYLLLDISEEKMALLETLGIESKDIIDILYCSFTEKENTFFSKDTRNINTPIIKFDSLPNGRDAKWIYVSLQKCKAENAGLTPEENAMYLAYKCLFDPRQVSDNEKRYIYLSDGEMSSEVAYEYLLYKDKSKQINEAEKKQLKGLSLRRYIERKDILNKQLERIGSSIEKLKISHPDILNHIIDSVLLFSQKRYNACSPHLLYLDLNGFLHIYLRHVIEFQFSKQFEGKDKFQLKEDDIKIVMNHVLNDINDDYQAYKAKNPNNRYSKYGAQSYYYNGDYYTIQVNEDGSIGTFYKNRSNRNIHEI